MTTADRESSGIGIVKSFREHLDPGSFTVFCAQCKQVTVFCAQRKQVIILHIIMMDQLPLTPHVCVTQGHQWCNQ